MKTIKRNIGTSVSVWFVSAFQKCIAICDNLLHEVKKNIDTAGGSYLNIDHKWAAFHKLGTYWTSIGKIAEQSNEIFSTYNPEENKIGSIFIFFLTGSERLWKPALS